MHVASTHKKNGDSKMEKKLRQGDDEVEIYNMTFLRIEKEREKKTIWNVINYRNCAKLSGEMKETTANTRYEANIRT